MRVHTDLLATAKPGYSSRRLVRKGSGHIHKVSMHCKHTHTA